MARTWRMTVTIAAVFVLAGCELTEVTIADSQDLVIAETRLALDLGGGDGGAGSLSVTAYLHRTLSAGRPNEVEGAVVRLSGESGAVVHLEMADSGGVCLSFDEEGPSNDNVGSCYRADISPSPFAPLEVVELEVRLPDGGVVAGSSRIPGAFEFVGLAEEGGRCRMEPDTNYRLRWTEAAETWAYVSDAWITGLPDALGGQIEDVPDSLNLTGLGIGQGDTDVVFPAEYGLFELDEGVVEDLLGILEEGLPGGTRAEIAFAATDRNFTNWIRGNNFNPSGLIRIPSVFGDGTGVFGTSTLRRLNVDAAPDGPGMPPLCGPPAGNP